MRLRCCEIIIKKEAGCQNKNPTSLKKMDGCCNNVSHQMFCDALNTIRVKLIILHTVYCIFCIFFVVVSDMDMCDYRRRMADELR